MKPRTSFRRFLFVIGAAIGLLPLFPLSRGGEENWDAPKVRVTTPIGVGYVMQPAGSERKFLICLEITDVAAAGIRTDTSGTPLFLEANHNTDVFADHIVARAAYTNHLGEDVIQLVSLVPLEKLKTDDSLVRPPIAYNKLRPQKGERDFTIAAADMVKAATFNFQVKDLRGVASDAAEGRVTLGFASRLWTPPQE